MQPEERPLRGSTFVAALLTTLALLAKPVLWAAIIIVLILFMLGEPL